jgi:hypothetical protein
LIFILRWWCTLNHLLWSSTELVWAHSFSRIVKIVLLRRLSLCCRGFLYLVSFNCWILSIGMFCYLRFHHNSWFVSCQILIGFHLSICWVLGDGNSIKSLLMKVFYWLAIRSLTSWNCATKRSYFLFVVWLYKWFLAQCLNCGLWFWVWGQLCSRWNGRYWPLFKMSLY